MKEGNEPKDGKQLGPFSISLLSILIGVCAGLGAVMFRGLIALFHNLFFLGKLSLSYDATVHTPVSLWGPLVIFVPVVGALFVAFLVKNFAPEARGTGVPEVVDSIYYGRGIMRPVVAVVKSLASSLSIGSGGPVGREGPIIQIGSAFGSAIGQYIPMSVWERITLIAAGAGGGIAATFNTPIGGMLFAIEIMMHEFSVKTLVPIAISTATATYVGRVFFGSLPSFEIPALQIAHFHLDDPWLLISFAGFGILLGGVSTLFIKSVYRFEDFFDRHIKGGYYVRHMAGMLLVGILMYELMATFGHYYIEGVGYSTIQDILSGTLSNIYLLLLLFVLKLLAISLTLGSGGSGGIFSPALYMGATLGGAYAILLSYFFPKLGATIPAFALAGMAGLVGSATGAAIAAIVMIFEMTLNYNVIIPMTITVALSYGMRKILLTESIYMLKLVRRGHYIPDSMQANLYYLKLASNMMDVHFRKVPGSQTLGEFTAHTVRRYRAISNYLIEENGKIIGLITPEDALEAHEQFEKTTRLDTIVSKDFVTVGEETKFLEVVGLMRSKRCSAALVIPKGRAHSADNVKGIITKEHITDFFVENVELFSN